MRERVSRRRTLAALGLTGSALLAGCNALGANENEPGDGDDGGDDNDTTTDTATGANDSDTGANDSGTATDDNPLLDNEKIPLELPYEFGLSPIAPQADMTRQYEPVTEYLSEELADTELGYAASYGAVLQALREGTFAFAEVGPFAAAFAVKNGAADVALQRRAYGSWQYTSAIVTRADSEIDSLDDLEGATLAFASPTSASGSLFPLWLLDRAGLSVGDAPNSDQGADFTAVWSSHAIAIKALEDGDVDAACVGQFIVVGADGELRNEFEYLDTYEGIPRAPIVTSTALPDETGEAFVDAMRNAPDRIYEGRDGDPNTDDDLWFSELRPADVATYEPVVRVIDELGLTADVLDQ